LTNEIKNWRKPFDASFTQLAGRVACLENERNHLQSNKRNIGIIT